MPGQLDVLLAQLAFGEARLEHLDAMLDLFEPDLPVPLERRDRLGDKQRHRHAHLHVRLGALVLGHRVARRPQHALAQIPDARDVLVRLAGKPDHEVELERAPTGLERAGHGVEEVLFVHAFVYGVAQVLRPRLGGERQAALLLASDQACKLHAKRVHALTGQAHALARPVEAAVEPAQLLDDGGVVRRRKRRERHLVVTGAGKPLGDGGDDRVRVALAHGAVDHARLAEAAAAVAPAQHLDGEAVVDELVVGHDGLGQRLDRVEILDDELLDRLGHGLVERARHLVEQPVGKLDAPRLVQRGNVEPPHLGKRAQHLGTRGTGGLELAVQERHLDVGALAFADEDGVEKRRVRLGVERAWPTAEDERIALAALGGAQRDTAQVERLEHIGRRHLMRQRDADEVELAKRRERLEGRQRQPLLAHERDHVDPRQVRALAVDAFVGVERIVENRDGLVGLADLVSVRIDHHRMVVSIGLVCGLDGPPLLAQIA